jgi:chromosome segregation ATPase
MLSFKRKSPMHKLETTLAQADLRRAECKRAAAQAGLANAIAARDRHHLEGDIADEQMATKLQAKVDHFASTVTGLDAALATLQTQISDIEAHIATERAIAERSAAADKLARDLDKIEPALPRFLDEARRLAGVLEELHVDYEAEQLALVLANMMTQVQVACGVRVTCGLPCRISQPATCRSRPRSP